MKISTMLWLFVLPSLVVAQSPLPSEINIVEMGAGRVFVSEEGFTLYTYKRDSEQAGTSVCIDDCAIQWPPLPATDDAITVGDWSVIGREGGSHQWAYKGSPVYRHAKDSHPGAMVGEKASVFWDVLFEPIHTPAGISIKGTPQGQTLVDRDGRILHMNDADSCIDKCLQNWRPLEAPWLAGAGQGDWTVTRHPNGLVQWTFRNQLLFTLAGDYSGQAVSSAQADQGWQVVILQNAPGLPDWVTIQETDFGAVLADTDRMTLYFLVNDPEQIARETCDEKCAKENWRPITASAGSTPIGNWSTQPLADGIQQWTYLGLPVYTYKHDASPGDTRGDKFAAGAGVRGGWMAILEDTLTQKLN